jgi:hypothetical protein
MIKTVGVKVEVDTKGAPQKLHEVQAGLTGVGQAANKVPGPAANVAGAMSQAARSTAAFEMSAKQTTAAMRMIPAQFTDIVTSLQGGQNPLTVLMQQGGQLKDSFGGAGAASRALGGYVMGLVNPFSAAAAAAGVVGLAYYQGSQEADEFRRVLLLSGNAAGASTDQLAGLANQLGSGFDQTVGRAAEAITAIASTGQVGRARLGDFAATAMAAEKAFGTAVSDIAKNFAELGKDPTAAAVKLNEGMNFLTASTFAQIRAAQDLGQESKAAALAQDAYNSALKGRSADVVNNAGTIEKAWGGIKSVATEAWDAMLGVGRPITVGAQLAVAQKNLEASLAKRRGVSDDSAFAAALDQEIAKLKTQVSYVNELERMANRAGDASAERVARDNAGIQAQKDGLKYLSAEEKMRKDIAQQTAVMVRAGLSQVEIEDRVSKIRASYAPQINAAAKAAQDQAAAATQFSVALQKLTNQDLIADVKSRVAMQVLTEEEGAKEITRITLAEIQQRVQAEQRLAGVYGKDPAKAAAHANAAKLATQEATNAQNAGLRELAAMADKRDRAYAQALAKVAGDSIERRQSLEGETQALQLQTEQARAQGIVINSVVTLLEREKAERYGVALAMAEQNLQAQTALGLTAEQTRAHQVAIEQLRAMRDAAQGVAQASANKDLAQAGLDQAKRLGGGPGDAQADPFKELGSTLRETFATAGDGLARMVDAMGTLVKSGQAYASEMRVIEELRNSGDDKNRKTADENELRLIKKTEAAQINAYASMASAAKGYFGKQTAAYKVLHGAEQALRTYQLVMSAQTMAKDLAAIGTKVSAWLAGDTAIATSAMTSAGTQVAASTMAGTASAAAGVANQAKGDPYTAFPRMAAMAAMMLALGFAVSGGGGGGTTYDAFAAQKANDGTGTVFGDAKAQSQSIQNSLQALESIARPELQYTSQMVMHLRSIDQALGGATGLLLSQGLLGSDYQGVSSGGSGFLGFSKSSSSSSVSSEGVNFAAQSVAQAMQGIQAAAYRVIQTQWSSSSWWGLSKSSGTNYSTSWGSVAGDVTDRFTRAVANMRNTAIAAADVLGNDTAAQLIDALDTGLGKVEWKPDASFEDINKQISAVFSQLGDRMAQTVLPQIQDFALGGEGYLETLTRVSSGMEEAGLYADRFGLSLASLATVQGNVSDVAAELLRQTVLQAEAAGSGIAGIVRTFTGNASDMADLYASLQSLRQALVSMGQSATAVTVDLIKGAGSLDALTNGMSAFESDFLTAAERAAAQQARLASEFARIGVLMPTTAEQFKSLVKTIDTSTANGQKALGGLLSLSSGFKELLDTQEAAGQAARDAAEAQAKAQKDWLDKLQSAGKTISQWIQGLDSGNLGASSPQDKLALARGQYIGGLSLARTSDQDALTGITGQAQAYLQAARETSSSEGQYMAVLAQVRSELRMLPAVKSYEAQHLDALALINTSVQTDLISTLNARFTSLDANVDGLLTYSELRTGLGFTDAQINALMAVVDANGDGQISAIEAQRAATLGVLGATQDVGSGTASVYDAAAKQYQALVAMNDQSMYAVSFNTASMLSVMGQHSAWLRDIAASTAKTAATPVTVVQQTQKQGLLGKIFGGLFADGGVFDGQGIYNQPTAFSFDGGRLGIMGEAGPEAVMPLMRMGDGALGVRAQMHLVHHMAGGGDMTALVVSLQAGFERLAQHIDRLDDNNNRGNAAIANATAKTAKVLDSASRGDTLQVEVVTI